nr:hypothetical protein [Bacillus toyonensis]
MAATVSICPTTKCTSRC